MAYNNLMNRLILWNYAHTQFTEWNNRKWWKAAAQTFSLNDLFVFCFAFWAKHFVILYELYSLCNENGKSQMQEHKRFLVGKPWLRVSMLACLVDVEHILPDGWSFGSWDGLSLSLPLFLSFQTAQHLTLRPQGFNKHPELHWVKQGRNSSITAIKTAREHLCACVRKKMCISMY